MILVVRHSDDEHKEVAVHEDAVREAATTPVLVLQPIMAAMMFMKLRER